MVVMLVRVRSQSVSRAELVKQADDVGGELLMSGPCRGSARSRMSTCQHVNVSTLKGSTNDDEALRLPSPSRFWPVRQ
jgi:hypothetical protein